MALAQPRESETTILARLFSDRLGQLPSEMARYILDLDFNDRDKARLHELVLRNQADALNPTEKEELLAFLKAGSMLATLQSKARRRLGIRAEGLTGS
jgi:hypothetical protein